MSKLAILSVAVTIFFFTVIAEDLGEFDKRTVINEIRKAKDIIKNSSSTIRSQVYEMSPDHNIANICFNILPKLRNEIKEDKSPNVHYIVDMMFNQTGIDEPKCRNYVSMYKEKKSQVQNFLDSLYRQAFENATAPILRKLEGDVKALGILDALENRANTCIGVECNDISGQLNATIAEFNKRTEDVLQTYRNWFAGPSVEDVALNEPVYKELQDLELNLTKKTMDCMLASVCAKSSGKI